MTTRPEALITTPTEAAYCPDCDQYGGARFESDRPTFAHCPQCGSTCLLDQRSPFEVLADARLNAFALDLDPGVRMERQDVVERVKKVCEASLCSCSDCASWRRRTGFAQIVPNYDLLTADHDKAQRPIAPRVVEIEGEEPF